MSGPHWPGGAGDGGKGGDDASGKRARLVEDLFILLSVLSLWPVILGWRHVAYQVVMYAALAGLVFILVRRVRRFARARDG